MSSHLMLSVFLLLQIICQSTILAENSYIVLLKQSSVDLNGKIHHKKLVKEQTLNNFVKSIKSQIKSLNNPDSYDLLPVINGVTINLSKAELNNLRSDNRVYKIIPNSPVSLDKPLTQLGPLGALSWGRRHIPRPPNGLNEALLLHKIDQLIKDGIDIYKPGKTVGVVDTGVDGTHPALKGKILKFKNFQTGSIIALDDKENPHGTHVCGIIAGDKIRDLQIGVYPGARLIVAALNFKNMSNVIKALEWMLDPDGDPQTKDQPFVVNNSWNIRDADPEPFYRLSEAFKAADILLAYSAGNQYFLGLDRPKEHPVTLTSASVNSVGEISSFSAWGPASYKGKNIQKPEIAVMGEDVYSLAPYGQYIRRSGTSMSSPFTAGVIALLGTYFPDKSPYYLAEILKQTTVEQQQSVTQWHKQMGYGLLDAYAAYLKLKSLDK